MPRLIRYWEVGAARGSNWRRGLPMPLHRTMGDVLLAERADALDKGAKAFAYARENEEAEDEPA